MAGITSKPDNKIPETWKEYLLTIKEPYVNQPIKSTLNNGCSRHFSGISDSGDSTGTNNNVSFGGTF